MPPRKKHKTPPPVTFADDKPRERWDRQPKEPDLAWRAFQLYRDMPIGERSQRAVDNVLHPDSPRTGMRRRSQIGEWSVRWSWKERCNAHDTRLDQERQAEFAKDAERDAHAALALFRAMRAKASRGIVALNPSLMTPLELTRMADVAVTAIRREQGLSTENIGKASEQPITLRGLADLMNVDDDAP